MLALEKTIVKYINTQAAAPTQKSAEWYKLKQKTIGGSEVATVLGLNPYKKVHGLIAEKICLPGTKFDGNIATRWGNLFENVTKDFTHDFLKMTSIIREAGSIEGIIERQRYSPDGLGVVKLKTGEGCYDYFIVLFEFKSPLRSIPDGKVPKQYLPQVLTGMLTIDIVETSIFVNNCYRKCPLSDINFNVKYDTIFHDGDLKKKLTKAQAINKVYAVGMICFYQTKDEADSYIKYCGYAESDNESDTGMYSELSSSEYDISILLDSMENPIDFGASKYNIINRLLELYDEKRIHAYYLPMVLNNDVVNEMEFAQLHKIKHTADNANPRKMLKQQYNLFLAECDEKNHVPVGYLPWKLIKTDIISVDADENWQETIEPPIKETLKTIDELMKIDNIDDRSDAFNELYPSKEYISKKDTEDLAVDCSDLFNDNYEELELDE